MPNQDELMTMINKAQGYVEGADITLPLIEAQRDELRLLMAAMPAQNPVFRRGQFVRYRPRLGAIRGDLKIALVFWDRVDLTNPGPWLRRTIKQALHSEVASLPEVDCLLAYLSQATLAFHLSFTGFLEPDPEA